MIESTAAQPAPSAPSAPPALAAPPPIPRQRGRWGRRVARFLVATVVVVFLAHATWNVINTAGVNRRVSALKGAGEPILPSDFATPPNSPDNGGIEIIAACEAVELYDKANPAFGNLDLALPLRPDEQKVIQTALLDLAPALAQFQQGANKPRHDWGLDLTQSPVLINVMVPQMAHVRGMANLLAADALLQHQNGDDAAALRRLDDILFLARFADRHPSLVGHLVSLGCNAIACDKIFDIAPEMKIGAAPGAVSPAQARQMIDRLLDDAAPREGLRLALRGERMAQLDAVRSLLSGLAMPSTNGQTRQYNPLARYIFAPLAHRNSIMMLDYMGALLPLSDEPDLPAVTAKLPPLHTRGNPMNLLADILLPSVERIFETHHRCTSDRRLAATALAIRWYQLEHDGKRPAKLDDLVPKYLPAVPKDSLLRDKPLGYLPDTQRPRLYSAGANNVDDNGSDALMRPSPDGRSAGRGDEWRTLDRCVFLDRQPRRQPEPELTPDLPDLPPDDSATTAPTTTTAPH